jgi:hypothetical protein
MDPKVGSAQHEIARIAGRQHGVVTLGQFLAAGLSRQQVKGRVAKGALHREHRGVYRVGHRAPSTEARCMAAVLACGEHAVLSGRAAAFLFGLIKGAAPTPEVSTTQNRRVARVVSHRVRHLDPRDVSVYRAIPITTVPRTLVDLAGPFSLDALARACHEGEVRHRITTATVLAALARKPTAPGAWKLREIFDGQARITLSKLERDFLALLQGAGLPLPQTNRLAHGRYVSTVVGPSTASPSSWTAIDTTTRATPGSRIGGANARRAHAATSSGATPTAMSPKTGRS